MFAFQAKGKDTVGWMDNESLHGYGSSSGPNIFCNLTADILSSVI